MNAIRGCGNVGNTVKMSTTSKVQNFILEQLKQDLSFQETLKSYVPLLVQSQSDKHPISFEEAVDSFMDDENSDVMLLTGVPGSGKTTEVKRLAWHALNTKNYLVIYVSLPDLKDCFREIKQETLTNAGFSPSEIWELKEEKKKILWVLDGYNKVKFFNFGFHLELRNFFRTNHFEQWPNSKVIFTSIPEFCKFELFGGNHPLRIYSLLPLNKDIVVNALKSYDGLDPDILKAFSIPQVYFKALPHIKTILANLPANKPVQQPGLPIPVIATLSALGYTKEEIEIFLQEPVFRPYTVVTQEEFDRASRKNAIIRRICDIISQEGTNEALLQVLWTFMGIHDGEDLRLWMDAKIKEKTGVNHCNFDSILRYKQQIKPLNHIVINITKMGETPLTVSFNTKDFNDLNNAIISDVVSIALADPILGKPRYLYIKELERKNAHSTIYGGVYCGGAPQPEPPPPPSPFIKIVSSTGNFLKPLEELVSSPLLSLIDGESLGVIWFALGYQREEQDKKDLAREAYSKAKEIFQKCESPKLADAETRLKNL